MSFATTFPKITLYSLLEWKYVPSYERLLCIHRWYLSFDRLTRRVFLRILTGTTTKDGKKQENRATEGRKFARNMVETDPSVSK